MQQKRVQKTCRRRANKPSSDQAVSASTPIIRTEQVAELLARIDSQLTARS